MKSRKRKSAKYNEKHGEVGQKYELNVDAKGLM